MLRLKFLVISNGKKGGGEPKMGEEGVYIYTFRKKVSYNTIPRDFDKMVFLECEKMSP